MFDVLDDLEEAIDKLAAGEGFVDVVRICKLVDRLEFQRLRAIGEFDRSGVWAAEGFVSTASALRSKTRCSHGHAHRSVRSARKLEQLPETSAAFGTGEITAEHVDEITRPYTPERAGMLEGIEAELVAFARLSTPNELHDVVQQMTDAFDGHGGAKSDNAEHDLNKVTLSGVGGRGILNGSLDPELTDLVQTALDAEMETLRRKAETRTSGQLRAAALESICRWYLCACRDSTARGRGRTHVNIVYDIGPLDVTNPTLAASARADTAHGQRLSRTTRERITCDCRISRIITDGPSNVLDVGRVTRTVNNSLWNALTVRDRHCTAPRCDRPPGMCEAHHIRHWEHGGPTNLDNLKLLCWHHHKQQHIHDAQARAG